MFMVDLSILSIARTPQTTRRRFTNFSLAANLHVGVSPLATHREVAFGGHVEKNLLDLVDAVVVHSHHLRKTLHSCYKL